MLEALRELSLTWYAWLSRLGAELTQPLQGLAYRADLPALSALALGVIGSMAPCQMSANVAAIAYASGRAAAGPRGVLRTAVAYLAGKIAVYAGLGGAAIGLGYGLPAPALGMVRRLVGPAMILLGLSMLGLVRLHFSPGTALAGRVLRRLPDRGAAGAFLLGAGYSLAFCPTMALLFFGLLVPLGIRSQGGLALPAFFAAGTALPLLSYCAFLSLGLGARRDWLEGTRRLDRYVRAVAGTAFVVLGVNDTLLYWFL